MAEQILVIDHIAFDMIFKLILIVRPLVQIWANLSDDLGL